MKDTKQAKTYIKTNLKEIGGRDSLFIVVAPECNFIEELKEQGVLFYKYDQKEGVNHD